METTGVDASPGGDGNGSSMIDAPSSSAACPNGRVVYLAFEGVTLTKAATSDATQDLASWIGVNTAAVPKYRPNDNNRMGKITNIVDGVKARLAATPIQVVTTRPAAGPYVMIVLGGTNQIVGTNYTYATSQHDCGDTVKSDVGWISDAPSVGYVPDLVIGTIGWGLGLNGTTDPADCMCAWATQCSPSGACTLSTQPTGQLQQPATACPNQNPQDEVSAFTTQFCQ
jgi:hypothetical protein